MVQYFWNYYQCTYPLVSPGRDTSFVNYPRGSDILQKQIEIKNLCGSLCNPCGSLWKENKWDCSTDCFRVPIVPIVPIAIGIGITGNHRQIHTEIVLGNRKLIAQFGINRVYVNIWLSSFSAN